jgi:hypothetical protein
MLSAAAPSGVPYEASDFSATASFLSNIEAAEAQLRKFQLEWFRTHRQVRRIDFDNAVYGQHRYPVPGSYSAESNEVTISLIGLRSLMGGDMHCSDRALWYGSAGFVLGHELIHLILSGYPELGVEDQAQCDSTLRELAVVYDEVELELGMIVNGNRTARENFADLMGLDLAYRAMCNAFGEEHGSMRDKQADDEQFFLVNTRMFGGISTTEYLASRLRWDPHAPFSVRAEAARHQPAFAETFNCPTPDFEVRSLAVRLSGNSLSHTAPTEQVYAEMDELALDAGETGIIYGDRSIHSAEVEEDVVGGSGEQGS